MLYIYFNIISTNIHNCIRKQIGELRWSRFFGCQSTCFHEERCHRWLEEPFHGWTIGILRQVVLGEDERKLPPFRLLILFLLLPSLPSSFVNTSIFLSPPCSCDNTIVLFKLKYIIFMFWLNQKLTDYMNYYISNYSYDILLL